MYVRIRKIAEYLRKAAAVYSFDKSGCVDPVCFGNANIGVGMQLLNSRTVVWECI